MRVLITGAGGFIGRALCLRLASMPDFQVFGVGRREQLPSARRFTALKADLVDDSWTDSLPSGGIDLVFHLAQSTRYREFPDGAEDMLAVNVKATLQLLEWCRENGVRRVVLASSGNVYRWGDHPLRETDQTEPDSFYGASKLAMEVIARPFASFFPIVAARLFTVYGPYQEEMLIPNLLSRVRSRIAITVAGGIGPVFSPLWLDDGVEFLMRCSSFDTSSSFEVLNLAGSEIISVRRMAEVFGELTGARPLYEETADKPLCYAGDSSRAVAWLKYSPNVSFRDGASRIISLPVTRG